jgi:hypothetical protein
MSTLAEIESAAKRLPPAQKQELLVFLADELRSAGQPLPELRRFSSAEVQSWLDEDERDMREFQGRA